MSEPDEHKNKQDDKWDFSDYAFTITGIIVGVLLVGPELLETLLDISILGGSLSDGAADIVDELQVGVWSVGSLRALSPMLFLLTTTIVFFQEAIVARKTGGYKGTMFTHTFESLLEEAIYMAITTIMVYSAIFMGAMYISWLSGPISWVLFVFIFPLVRQKNSRTQEEKTPWLMLLILALGIAVEAITQAWVAFPLSWLIICTIKLANTIRQKDYSADGVFEIIYYVFSVVLMAVGVGLGFWMASWVAFPLSLIICWALSKFGLFSKGAAV